MHVNRIDADGRIGVQVETTDWSSGWTIARPFGSGGQTFLFRLKSATGDVRLNAIRPDGTIGPVTDTRRFGAGWTTGAVIRRGANAALLLIKA